MGEPAVHLVQDAWLSTGAWCGSAPKDGKGERSFLFLIVCFQVAAFKHEKKSALAGTVTERKLIHVLLRR